MMLTSIPSKFPEHKETQTEVEYPTITNEVTEVIKRVEVEVEKEVIKTVPVPFEVIKEVIKEVPVEKEVIKEVEVEKEIIKEIVREIHVREDTDKIDDTNITQDESGRYQIFEHFSTPDDPETEDSLTEEFTSRTKISQIKILLAEVKRHLSNTDEAFIKIEYIKKLYAEQLRKLLVSQRSLQEKQIEIDIKNVEIQMKDNMLKEQDDGNNENLTLFRQQEANQNKMIAKLQE